MSSTLKSKKSNTQESSPQVITFPHDQLIQALYWTWDAFDRALMGMFLVYGTAETVLQNKLMEGDRITVGVRKNEWFSGSTPILKSFTGEPVSEGVNFVIFKNPFNEVPVYVYLFSEDSSVQAPAEVFYQAEYFKIPNSYTRFIKVFGEKP